MAIGAREPSRGERSKRHPSSPFSIFFSSAQSFPVSPGPRIDPERVAGYYIDLRAKPALVDWPPDWVVPGEGYVDIIQWGLGAYERYLAGEGDSWLERALAVGRYLVEAQCREGPRTGGWEHLLEFPHTYRLHPPWLSAMAQGEGASLLVRLHLATGEDVFAEAALGALRPMAVPTAQGGVQALLDGRPLPEEYPTDPPAFVLNGAIFSLWGYLDVHLGLGHTEAGRAFEEGISTLALNIHRWDLGFWSRYDLYPHPVPNIASIAYHLLHIGQLRVLTQLTPQPEFGRMLARFEDYEASRAKRIKATTRKMLFRLLVPRNRLLAKRVMRTRGRRLRRLSRD
jgi:heparosan-N-sulfate-glucuronate 5-epimerase